MSYHSFTGETHACEACGTFFLPFERDLPCPRCGEPTGEFYDFVTEATEGLDFQKRWYGRYSPGAFFVGGLPEHVFLLLCNAFDEIEGDADFRAALTRHLDASDWGDQAYLRTHVRDIALRVHERLKT